jgi:hypothetical protein
MADAGSAGVVVTRARPGGELKPALAAALFDPDFEEVSHASLVSYVADDADLYTDGGGAAERMRCAG